MEGVGGGGDDFVTGRNIFMKRMRMFVTRTGIKIDLFIYIGNKVTEELMKEKFSSGSLVPRFKDLERGDSILICALRLERNTEKARRWDEAAGLSKQNWDMGTALALGKRDSHPPPTTLLETKLCLLTYVALQDTFLGEVLSFTDQVLELRKTMDMPKIFGTRDQWYNHRCRQLVWSVFDEGVTYCGCWMTPDGFFQPN